jgi:ketosteroid isomerase-like protein
MSGRLIIGAVTAAAFALVTLPALATEAPTVEATLTEARAKIAAAAAKSRANAKTPEEKAIVEADLAFAADAAKRGAGPAFKAVYHSQGKLLPARSPVAVGPDAVAAVFKDDTSLWEWAPVEAVANGDLGVTWGIAAISGKGEDGKPFAVTTRYTTVWRKDATGVWKIWMDVGTPGPLP